MIRVMGTRPLPAFQTDRLTVRPLARADREDIYRNWLDRAVTVWFLRRPVTAVEQVDEIVDEYLQQMAEGVGAVWVLQPAESEHVIGTCGYEGWTRGGSGEIGFDLARAWWGRGLMAEALIPVVGFGFEELGLLEIVAHTDPANRRAIGLLQRLGFRDEGEREDSHHFAVSAEAWRSGELRGETPPAETWGS